VRRYREDKEEAVARMCAYVAPGKTVSRDTEIRRTRGLNTHTRAHTHAHTYTYTA